MKYNYIETSESIRKTLLTFLIISIAIFILTPFIMSVTGLGYLPIGITDLVFAIATILIMLVYGTLK